MNCPYVAIQQIMNCPPQYVDRRNMLLGKIIGKFKMNSAGEINKIINNAGNSFWQRNYYEHIIRNEKSLHRIRQYIINNPRKWHEDIENPKNNIPIKERNNHYKNLLSDR
ncbi:MAG: transposase [Patescibacteria group bacterium]